MKLIYCNHQSYNWGKKGSCLVSNFSSNNNNQLFSLNDHYAELWISMHRKTPSYIDKNKTQILDIDLVKKKINNDVSVILTKLISVGKPLSIQIHPDKKNAVKLHKLYPILYQDDNSKNELIVALSSFKLLCGYNNLVNIKKNIEARPILKQLWNNDNYDTIDHLYNNLMSISQLNGNVFINKHIQYCETSDKLSIEDEFFMLITKYYNNHLSDVSVFLVYLMNCVKLEQHEGIYIESLTPHCYISGDGIEIMDSSDNVIRCGLTNKYINVNLFQQLMNKTYKPVDIIKPELNTLINQYCQTGICNFQLSKIELKTGDNIEYLIKNYGFIIVLNGRCLLSNSVSSMEISYGNVILIISDCIMLKNLQSENNQSSIIFIAESV